MSICPDESQGNGKKEVSKKLCKKVFYMFVIGTVFEFHLFDFLLFDILLFHLSILIGFILLPS